MAGAAGRPISQWRDSRNLEFMQNRINARQAAPVLNSELFEMENEGT